MDPTMPDPSTAGERDASPTAAGDASRPRLDQLADDRDQLGWNREQHGRMADHATADDAVETVDADSYLDQLGDASPRPGGDG